MELSYQFGKPFLDNIDSDRMYFNIFALPALCQIARKLLDPGEHDHQNLMKCNVWLLPGTLSLPNNAYLLRIEGQFPEAHSPLSIGFLF